MKKLLPLQLGLLLLFLMSIPNFVFAEGPSLEEPIMQIPVMSDTHICGGPVTINNITLCDRERFSYLNDDNFPLALNDYKTIAPNYKALAIVGDLVDRGLASQYDVFNRILDEGIEPNAEKIITMGNHEFFERKYRPTLTDEDAVNTFLMKTGMPGLYYDKWIEGYHFITLAGEYTVDNNFDNAFLSDAQYEWLEKTLPIKAISSKPIFVFLHQPINNTVYGSEFWNAGPDKGRLKRILQQYPQVIMFSGHSHYELSHPRTVYQDGFTMVNTGAVNYGWASTGYIPGKSQGLLVNVYKNRVDIKARDFKNGTWIKTYSVAVPFKDTTTDYVAPYFEDTAEVYTKDATNQSITLSWDQAIDDQLVERYVFKSGTEILGEKMVEFWKPLKAVETFTLKNLKAGETYDVEIVGVDSYGNETPTSLKTSFVMQAQTGWVQEGEDWYYYDPATGELMTGWLQDRNNWYYLDETGKQTTGWLQYQDKWYYLDDTGKLTTGWLQYQDKWYYLDDTGKLTTGWLQYQDKWYFLDDTGKLTTGWLQYQNKWYYFDSSGKMKTGWFYTQKKWYYFDSTGKMTTGWLSSQNKWYYFDSIGTMQTGWVKINQKYYFFANNGELKVGWVYTSGKWYYNTLNGMHTGWFHAPDGKWYFFQKDGSMKIGWLYQDGKWYYFDKNGIMKTGKQRIDGKNYTFSSSGVMLVK
ncbi:MULTISPECIES: metallophosphoesterase [unclassified Bacillus (in: firmicutes)]|uniref:metallophosphoesterase n=1 Tax=unclassified Bacillus (in: firmicutes) TaxID=185979 RepID=UPI0008E90312|nr:MULTISPECIES: metallophosphoesterase [unclassified Bacillus (in: firmicutes)]SFB20550.1 Glucan-binding domain-containing protein (YG repeat) [Bacillus sp. UNCCL13]SFQ90881.1 Glucan-binding domain-containing protein (YG repeat) [Bacillus sp. cl95]